MSCRIVLLLLLIAWTGAYAPARSDSPVPAGGADASDYLTLPRITDQAQPLPVELAPGNADIRYDGRFDLSDPAGPRCSWSASTVELWVKGSALEVKLKESSNNDEYEVAVDGIATEVLVPQAGVSLFSVFKGADARRIHHVLLVKRTEGFFGVTQFLGFRLPRKSALVAPPRSSGRRLELIGDSISCGFGNEAKDQNEKFTAQTENAYLSYGDIAVRRLGADYVCVAWSGRLMWPTNTMADVYGRILAQNPESVWDFSRWTPDVVVINLGTNDAWNDGFADPKAWVYGYEQFIARLRGSYPNALIYCTSSPMLTGDKDATERSLIHQVVQALNSSGDQRVKFLDFPTQDPSNGLGAQWHPSIRTHELMAAKLSQALEADLGWTPLKSP